MLAALAGPGPAFAQAVPGPALAPPTREEVQRAAPPPGSAPPSRLTVQGEIDRGPCPLAAPEFARVAVPLKGVAFDHLQGLPPEALRPAYQAFVGGTVPLATMCEIRDAATAILRRAGYLAAVQVPAQRVGDDGIVHFDVVMARLVRVQVQGRAGRSTRLLAAYLDKLADDPVFNEKQAERYLLLARDLPGYDVHLTLRPAGTVPGEVVGEVTATRLPFVVSANVQNYGSHGVGRWGVLANVQANDLIGVGDRLTLGVFNTAQVHEQSVAQAGYDMRIGGEGLTVGGRFTYAWTRPDLGGGVHSLSSRTLVASLEAAYPVRRSQTLDLRGVGGVDVIDQRLDYLGAPLTRDRLRIAYARLDFGATDPASLSGRTGSLAAPRWRIVGSLEARHGLGILNATHDCGGAPDYARCATLPTPSRLQGDPTATLLRFSGEADYRPVRRFTLAFSPRLQYAFDPLLSYEQYSGGAYTIGRGYDPGVIVGDSGAGATLEARYGTPGPKSQRALAVQPYLFLDSAWIWNREATDEIAHDRLLSAGGGVRAAWGDHARLDLSVATPLARTATQTVHGNTRVLLSLTTRLTPWGR